MIKTINQLREYIEKLRNENSSLRISNFDNYINLNHSGNTKIYFEFCGGPTKGGSDVQMIYAELNTGLYHYWVMGRASRMGHSHGEEPAKFAERHMDIIDHIMSVIDIKSLFNQLYKGAMVQMVARLPVYAAIITKFKLIEDVSAGTLYVTFNPVMLSYEIHYNPEFIVRAMVTHAISNDMYSLQDYYRELTGFTALMFSHEMEHVLRANLGSKGESAEALEGVDPRLTNLVTDSLINQKLSRVFMKRYPSVGIVQNLHYSFVIPRECTNIGDIKLIERIASSLGAFGGIKPPTLQKSRSRFIVKEPLGKITVILNQDIISLYKNNSNQLAKDIDKFIKSISDTLSLDDIGEMLSGVGEALNRAIGKSSGRIKIGSPVSLANPRNSESGNSSQSSEGSSGGISSDSGESQETSPKSSPSKSSSSSSSDSSSPGAGVGGGIGEPKSLTSMSDSEKALAQRVLGDIVDAADPPTLTPEDQVKVDEIKKENIKEEDVKVIMSTAEQSIIQKVHTGSSVSTWRRQFSKLLAQCLGIKEVYSNEIPSARIEGAFGREEEVPELKTIVLAIDCSGSMGPEQFQKVIKEVEVMGKAINSRSLEVKVVYWGSTAYLYKTKGTKGLVAKVKANAKNLGGTSFNEACNFMMKKTSKFDVLVVMTDGEFSGDPESKAKSFITKNKRKVIWVLTPNGDLREIAKYDPSFKQRLIKQK